MIKKVFFLFFVFLFFSVPHVFARDIDTGRISGQLMIRDGGPMSGGMVVFFDDSTGPPPDPDRYLRVPDQIGAIDSDGSFSVELPSGKYYMGAIKRMSGEEIGPPRDGDYFFISEDDEGNPLAYVIEKGKSVSVGIISEAVPFTREIAEDATGISGTVRDVMGAPVEGAIVFAYFTETMTGLPPFTSYRTGAEGKYFISVGKAGKYYLRVRDIYGGGPPVPGAVMGGYGEEKPEAVTVKPGEITKGIDIRVIRHLERGPKGRQLSPGADNNARQEQKKKIEQMNKN